MDSKKMLEIVESVKIPDTYTLYTSDIIAIVNAVNGDCCKAICYAFRYGFLKGQRAEKARSKKQRKESNT